MGTCCCASCGRITFSGSCGCQKPRPELHDADAGYWIRCPEEDWTGATRSYAEIEALSQYTGVLPR